MAVVKRYLAGATAVLTLGCALSAASFAEAAIVNKAPEGKVLGLPPIACAPSQHKFIIDGGDVDLMCGGKAVMDGPGWVNYVWPDAVNRQYYYVTGYGEDGTEKISVYPTITAPGLYEVWVSYRGSENRTEEAPFYVYADNGKTYRVGVNQKELHAGALFSAKLGTFYFNAHAIDETPRTGGFVTLQNEQLRASESLDAVFFKYVKPAPPAGVTASDATSTSAIYVRWKPVPGAKFYEVLRSAVNDPKTAEVIAGKGKIGPNMTVYKDTPLDAGMTYYYWVRTGGYLSKLSSLSFSNQGSTATLPPPSAP